MIDFKEALKQSAEILAANTRWEGDCLVWTAGRTSGYGVRKFPTGEKRAHRAALEVKLGGPIPNGLWALHSCDNPPCCNPDHLRPGTHQENSRDMAERGRAGRNGGRPVDPRVPRRVFVTMEMAEKLDRGEKVTLLRAKLDRGETVTITGATLVTP